MATRLVHLAVCVAPLGASVCWGQLVVNSDLTIDQMNSLPDTAIQVVDGLQSATRVELVTGGQLSPVQNYLVLNNGALAAQDIDLLGAAIRMGSADLSFDLDQSGQVNQLDLDFLIGDYFGTAAGDANLDLRFESSDFVTVFLAGRYETGETAGWASGDWNHFGR